jgi:hypothetical protein
MAPRAQLLSDPLTQSPDLAWHAYAVEYGLRMRGKGLRTGVADIPLTHNSLSINTERLDEAHQVVAQMYADLLPVITTCGTLTQKTAQKDRHVWLASQRWRYRWLRDSVVLQEARKSAAGMTGVLADMRHDVDEVIERAPGKRLHIVNCSAGQPFAAGGHDPLELTRRSGVAIFYDCSVPQLPDVLDSCPGDSWKLITNLSKADIESLAPRLVATEAILGFHIGTGLWLLLGPKLTDAPPGWRSSRATPMGRAARVASAFLG